MPTLRKIVRIDEEKCTGCGLCVPSCAEGAIQIIDGKARLVSEIYCDGLGACLGKCPEEAITIEEREAEEFDEEATEVYLNQMKEKDIPRGCPGSMAMRLSRQSDAAEHVSSDAAPSELANWPVQLKLVSPGAPYFEGADLLLAADCVPFAMGDFHTRFIRGRTLVVGCPKLDNVDYYIEKLTEILKQSSINSLTVVHMEVPCCSGLGYIASKAVAASGKDIPVDDITITIQGEVMANEPVLV